jgi:hypothetical protein
MNFIQGGTGVFGGWELLMQSINLINPPSWISCPTPTSILDQNNQPPPPSGNKPPQYAYTVQFSGTQGGNSMPFIWDPAVESENIPKPPHN